LPPQAQDRDINQQGRKRPRTCNKDGHMKRTHLMAIAALFLLTANLAFAQSLGDVARSTRKGKTQSAAANHKYDNDNLPKTDHLSVVGPASSANSNPSSLIDAPQQPQGEGTAAANPVPTSGPEQKPAVEDKQQATTQLKDKLDAQKQKIESLNRELDLTQREYKLRAVAMYSDAGNRLRNASSWDKEDAQYKKDLEEKQKALDAAKQEMEEMNEQARKAGIRQKDE
jgi:hypothetical protein